MRNRRQESRATHTKCWTILSVLLLSFLLLQMHFTAVRQESPPPESLNHPDEFFQLQDAKRKSSHYFLEWQNWNIMAEKYVHSLSEIRTADIQHPHHINSPEQKFFKDCLIKSNNFGFCNQIPKLDFLDENKFFLNIGMSVVNIDKSRRDLDLVFKQKFIRNKTK